MGTRVIVGLRAAVVCLAALGLLWAGTASAQAGDAERAARKARDVSRDLNRVLVKARDQLAELSKLPSVQAQDAAACNADMAARAGSPRYTALGAIDLDGDLYCLSEPITSPVNTADRPYFLRAIGIRGFGVGDFQIGRATGVDSLGLGYAVIDPDGEVTGVVVSPISAPWLDQHVEEKRPKGAFDVLVTDGHGTILARAGHGQRGPGENAAGTRLLKEMLRDHRGSGRFGIAGERVASAFRTVGASEGEMHVAVSVRR